MKSCIDEITEHHNNLTDQHEAFLKEFKSLKVKPTDLEERSHRNVKMMDISEEIKQQAYIQAFLRALPPEGSNKPVILDRAHHLLRSPK
ncbi:Hypothetical predicted protein [Pelobates cultripes]|uniref:Uncharacterized protein n=1 Tax=Pelobates cultripes TaxID=61616 RepID=A0AAD1R9Z2_PELCU|nr:Hypothetical predicted protein [Pelobates cultripes]